ncbi:response regulator [Ramlibacter sp. MMS24-I3-19]|uniref:response regulator n=1 Tax=Ramlibacter sp. MMS24-I3-19 TaxID=3416606 RepID=UPI003D0355ED
MVQLHGGWISATSAGPGHGCSVTFGLPLLRTVPARQAPADAEPVAPSTSAGGELVLVAHDNPDVIWGMTKLLEKAGLRTLAAAGGHEALRLATEHQPQVLVLVLDLGMPDLDGREVARRVRELPWGRQALLVAATGWGQEHDMGLSLDAGFDAHLTKPVHAQQLLQLIAERRRTDA